MKSNIALLIIDIQNDYFEGGANPLIGSLEVSLKAQKVLNKFRENSCPVIHIQHISTREGSTFFIPNTIGCEIHSNVAPIEKEKVIKKNFPNSFRETELLDHLKSLKITDLVICGMMTHMCVDSTTRAAKDYGFNCSIISDACATKDLNIQSQFVSAKDIQNSFLAALAYFYSNILTTEEFFDRYDL